MHLRRRQFLKLGAALAGTAAGLPLAAAARAAQAPPAGSVPRRVALRNLHTDEALEIDYASDGLYLPDAMARVATLLRDFRSGEQHAIDPQLLDMLCDTAAALGTDPVFGVISGYRSPQTNAMLHGRSGGVAVRSLHMEGRAIDVRLHGVDSARLATLARDMGRGGVGFYRRSDFVHLDTGAARTWLG